MKTIPYSRQQIDEDDIAAVVAVLRSDFLTQGPAIGLFEAALAAYGNARHAIALSSGTAGLHLACLALGVGPGDLVWTSPISFVASANCARYVGADVDFVDCDTRTGNIDPAKLEEKLLIAQQVGRLPKLLVVVHFAGRSADMKRISALARDHGIAIVEDAAHALGARYDAMPVGHGRYSDMTLFSFHPVKSVTTGEGGALLLNDTALAEKIRLLRSHGITREHQHASDPDGWAYEMQALGYHYRMTDIQAALGTSQLRKLDHFIAQRRALAMRYQQLLADLSITLPPPDPDGAWHLYVVHIPGRRREIFNALRAQNILVNVHYIPIYRQPYYQQLGFHPGDFPAAEAFYEGALSLPLFPALTHAEQDAIVAALRHALQP